MPDPRATILVVDDETGPRESLRMILEPTHRVLQAATGAEALERLRTDTVDLVTLDLHMPGMRGEDVMRNVRREHPDVDLIVITGCGSVESAAEGCRLGVADYLQKPFDVVNVSASVTRALARQRSRRRLSGFLEELGALVGRTREADQLLGDLRRSQRLRERLRGVFSDRPESDASELTRQVGFLEVLAEIIETKDRFMRGHARRCAFYASLLADRLNLSADARRDVRLAAFLHDLGKVGVPTDLLLRAGALDPNERELVKQHPVIGSRLVAPHEIPSPIAHGIRHHHEWWDGSGYPDGLAGADIPLVARIVGLADAFDAMSCDRPYRRALTRDATICEIELGRGVQFDPDLAKEFLLLLEAGACDVDPTLVADAVAVAG